MLRYKRVAALPSETVGGDLLVVDAERDLFFSANAVGAFIWSRLESPVSMDELVKAVVDEFEIASTDDAKLDVSEFVEALRNQKIVEVVKQ